MKKGLKDLSQVPRWEHSGVCYLGNEGPFIGSYRSNWETGERGGLTLAWYYRLAKWTSSRWARAGSRSEAVISVEEQIEP